MLLVCVAFFNEKVRTSYFVNQSNNAYVIKYVVIVPFYLLLFNVHETT